ncbi:MAG: uridine diphosphate-N-acetylglucosamine-binding protein YvcK [Endomicrobia bacterium]|nr:uridine diphosphate-N-acetylglucosamine-binding protein YvcK [Endomicrobiia bacterium]MDW8055225.1 uridine diphosphate-N-acetylglucosamine-binding protein YvcK [Elusimicrobiota bacterium]
MISKRIVCIGGGTGIATLLRGLKKYENVSITAVVTVMDDGGSSGRLVQEFGVVPPGDIRNCILALATEEDILTKIFSYRFPITTKSPQVGGHSLGNLLMVALSDIYGGFDKAISKISEILAVNGKVLPITLKPTQLVALLEDGSLRYGETNISSSQSPIKKLLFKPRRVQYYPEVVKEIISADMIVIGPGSLYTSILPNLIIEEISTAVAKSSAIKVYVCNVMTQHGETDGYTVETHIEKIYEHCKNKFRFDYVIVNSGKIPHSLLLRYTKQNSYPVKVSNESYLKSLVNKKVIKNDLIANETIVGKYARHDPEKLAKVIIKLSNRRD